MLAEWEALPEYMKNEEVLFYYKLIKKKEKNLVIKRLFDIVASSILILVLSPIMIILSILIKIESKEKVIFKQKRVTKYGKIFNIYKFRTMTSNGKDLDSQVTRGSNSRITKLGRILRKFKLDEFPQVFNIFLGDLSFVGVRPEVPKYVKSYTNEMMATLLLPAGVTSLTSIKFKDEEKILDNFDDVEKAYLEVILPRKMEINLQYIKKFNFFYDIKIMFMTVVAVIKN